MKEKNKLKICEFNILKGGNKRLDRISNVLKEINPDIVGLLEAVGWHKRKKYYKDLATRCGYKYFYLALANSIYNIAVFSKVPLSIKSIKRGIRHVAIQVTLKESVFKGVKIFFVHLAPDSESFRLREVSLLTKKTKNKSLIIGDLNSLSFRDPYNKKKLLSNLRKAGINKFGTNKLSFSVVKKLEKNGLVDAAHYLKSKFQTSTPTKSNRDVNHSVPVRIDYAFLSKDMTKYLKSARIFKNREAEQASDHYPLYIELVK